jgi:hypothetical protein
MDGVGWVRWALMVFGSERGGEIGKRVLVGRGGKVGREGKVGRGGVLAFGEREGEEMGMGTEWRLCNGSGSIIIANITLIDLYLKILVTLILIHCLVICLVIW